MAVILWDRRLFRFVVSVKAGVEGQYLRVRVREDVEMPDRYRRLAAIPGCHSCGHCGTPNVGPQVVLRVPDIELGNTPVGTPPDRHRDSLGEGLQFREQRNFD